MVWFCWLCLVLVFGDGVGFSFALWFVGLLMLYIGLFPILFG